MPGSQDAPELSVVMPARNAATVIGRQLDALSTQTWESSWEVLVVADGSTDGTADRVRRHAEHDPRVRVVESPGADSPAAARNAGAAMARGASLAFCDADDVVVPGWLASMGEALRRFDFVTGPLELDHLNPAWIVESRGRSFSDGPQDYEGVFPYASSCNLGLRKSVFENIGGFDTGFVVGEDIELSLRLWLSGVDLHFEPAAVVHYRYRPDLASTYRQARSYGRVRPVIAERLRRAGRPAPRRSAGARNWAWLLRHASALRSDAGRARWLWVAGTRIGNLEGSARVRRLYL